MTEELLKTMRSLIDLNSEEEKCIKLLFKEKRLKKGDFFLAEGQTCQYVGFIVQGLMRCFLNQDGDEKIYAFSKEGDFVCNYESFLPEIGSTKIIQALEDCTILQISKHDLQTFYNSVGGGERFARITLEYFFVDLVKDLTSFYIDSPELRYEKFLRKYSNLHHRIPQYLIASYIGVRPESLSRIRKRISERTHA